MTDFSPFPKVRPSRETFGERNRKHGHSNPETPTYRCWCAVIDRCTNPNNPNYSGYGGRGITICERWRHSFETFLQDMGERPSLKHSIDRWPDNDGNYEPSNCRWATQSQQCRNRKTCRAVIRSDGLQFPSMIEAAEATGGNRRCIRDCCTGRQKSHLGFTWRFAE